MEISVEWSLYVFLSLCIISLSHTTTANRKADVNMTSDVLPLYLRGESAQRFYLPHPSTWHWICGLMYT